MQMEYYIFLVNATVRQAYTVTRLPPQQVVLLKESYPQTFLSSGGFSVFWNTLHPVAWVASPSSDSLAPPPFPHIWITVRTSNLHFSSLSVSLPIKSHHLHPLNPKIAAGFRASHTSFSPASYSHVWRSKISSGHLRLQRKCFQPIWSASVVVQREVGAALQRRVHSFLIHLWSIQHTAWSLFLSLCCSSCELF